MATNSRESIDFRRTLKISITLRLFSLYDEAVVDDSMMSSVCSSSLAFMRCVLAPLKSSFAPAHYTHDNHLPLLRIGQIRYAQELISQITSRHRYQRATKLTLISSRYSRRPPIPRRQTA